MFIAYRPGEGEGESEGVVIGAGTIERVLVDRDRFIAQAGPPA